MEGLEFFQNHIASSIQTKRKLLDSQECLNNILLASEACLAAYQNGKKILTAGNGGSAADAQHIAAEFVSRFEFDRPGLPAIALTTDTSILTAIGNDYGYERLFSRQVEANGQQGDVFIGISTSGNSKNVLSALKTAKKQGVLTVGLCGDGGEMKNLCDISICIPSTHTPRIQESHILVGHMICAYVEERIFGDTHR